MDTQQLNNAAKRKRGINPFSRINLTAGGLGLGALGGAALGRNGSHHATDAAHNNPTTDDTNQQAAD